MSREAHVRFCRQAGEGDFPRLAINLTSKNGKAYSYADPAHVHAVTAHDGTQYGYDPNGSMAVRGAQVIKYDPERRPLRVEDAGVLKWRAAYDADGARRKRLDDKGTVHYPGGGYERNVGTGWDTTEVITKYYRALGRLLAFRKGGTLRWVRTDHLGSTIVVADAAFSPLSQRRYLPYGDRRDSGDLGIDAEFTSQTKDDSIGLYWYASRAYDPGLGRFVCADSIVPEAGNPQMLNRYSYCLATRSDMSIRLGTTQ